MELTEEQNKLIERERMNRLCLYRESQNPEGRMYQLGWIHAFEWVRSPKA